MIKLILLSVLGAAVFTTVAAESKASCGENSQPGCGQNCGKKCSDYPPGSTRVSFVCSQICRLDGCDCSPGFVFDNFTNSCVVPNDCRIKAVNCSEENEIYEICPAKCPPGVCGIDDRLVDCAASPQIGDANCAPPACRCQYGFYRNAEGKCVTLEECPPTCGDNEVASNCINGNCFGARYCSQKGAPIICVDLLPGTCESGCLCKKGYLRDDRTNQCVPEDKCPKIPKCKGVNQVYDYCPAPCPPRNCSVNSALIKCAAPPQLGDPDCKPGCRCKDGYKYGKNGDCIPEDQCDPFCYGNEVPSNCTNGGCQGAKYCSEKGADIKCVKLGEDQCVKGCLCRKGYLRDEITGICVKEDKCPKIPKCKGVNQVYDYCPAPCPPRNCSVNSAIIRCAAPPQLGDPECKPGCRCKDGYKYGKNGDCIPENQCDPFCYGNEVPSNCTNGGCQGAKYCSEKGAEIKCVKLSEDQCVKGCLCRKGYLRDEITGICVKEDKCPKIPKCKGVNQVYDYCSAPCPPRNCSVNEALISCITPPQLGDPECKPECRCKDGYKYGKNGDCIPEDQCDPFCYGNEVPSNCTNRGCQGAKYCSEKGADIKCVKLGEDQCVKGCLCRKGYLRDEITGICVKEDKCPKIPKCKGVNQVYDYCPAPCPPRNCSVNSAIIRCAAPPQLGDPECKPGCRCKDGYKYGKNGDCIPENQCDPFCYGNEVPSNCTNGGCQGAKYCSEKGAEIKCVKLSEDQCVKGCLCRKGYLRDEITGICVKEDKCPKIPKCKGVNQVYDYCPAPCPPRNCSVNEALILCITPPQLGDPECKPGCRCKDGYKYGKNGDCIPENQCEQNQCNRPNEVYQVCPGCSPQTCESIGKKYNCPLSPSPSITCKGACRCKPGFYRNKIGDCISRKNCLKCRGPNEFYSCGGACDNVCETLKVQNQTHCPIINVKCNEMCYCESGYARNKKGVCIPIKKCPPPRPTETCTGPNEKYDKCAPPCSPQGCSTLVGPTIRCLFVLPPGQCIGACRCIEGHYRNDKGICIPKEECELCTRKNEVYDECPPNCSPDTCASLYEDNSDCVAPDVCRPACRCTKGTYRNEDGDCVPVNDCPCKIGESFKSDDGCNTCSCGNGRRSDSACTLRVCEPSGTTFLNVRDVPTACPIGKSYLADDGCNTCDCTDGTRGTSICTASFAPCDLADPTAELE